MNVQCTHCNTVFRVDPRKVPAEGVRARCSVCRGVFRIEPGVASPGPRPAAEGREAVRGTVEAAERVAEPAPPVASPAPPTPAPEPTPRPEPAPVLVSSPAPAQAAAIAPAPASAPAATPRPSDSPFGASDPGAKARRLARALVSDIVTYHPERRDRALADGSIKREFMEEIRKSWEEFVSQVGAETARSTPHFRDALNDILAKGQPVF
jgi:predicted Zn finger-like uncharacterized protein